MRLLTIAILLYVLCLPQSHGQQRKSHIGGQSSCKITSYVPLFKHKAWIETDYWWGNYTLQKDGNERELAIKYTRILDSAHFLGFKSIISNRYEGSVMHYSDITHQVFYEFTDNHKRIKLFHAFSAGAETLRAQGDFSRTVHQAIVGYRLSGLAPISAPFMQPGTWYFTGNSGFELEMNNIPGWRKSPSFFDINAGVGHWIHPNLHLRSVWCYKHRRIFGTQQYIGTHEFRFEILISPIIRVANE